MATTGGPARCPSPTGLPLLSSLAVESCTKENRWRGSRSTNGYVSSLSATLGDAADGQFRLIIWLPGQPEAASLYGSVMRPELHATRLGRPDLQGEPRGHLLCRRYRDHAREMTT